MCQYWIDMGYNIPLINENIAVIHNISPIYLLDFLINILYIYLIYGTRELLQSYRKLLKPCINSFEMIAFKMLKNRLKLYNESVIEVYQAEDI